MKITRRQLRRIIREAVGDQLPYSMGGPWVDKDVPVGKGSSQYDDLDVELTDAEIEASMGWEQAAGDDALIDALIFGWAQWADDNGQPDPGLFAPQEKGDAALSWVSKNEPDIARQINALSTHNLKVLYSAAFDEDADRGHRTSAMDWIKEAYVGEEKWDAYEGYREVFWKEGDLVRKIDYYGTGYGEDYKKTVGDQVGQVIEIDEDPDGTQYTVLFADGSTIMDTGEEFEAAK